MMKNPFLVPAAILLAVINAYAEDVHPGGQEGPAVTVYSSADPGGFDPQTFIYQQRMGYDNFDPAQIPGFGVVKETRVVQLNRGPNVVPITDVAQFIDPTTVSFTDLTDDKTAVLQQQFKFDLVSPSKLLEKYVDQPVTVVASLGEGKTETVSGKLLSNNQGQMVLQTDDGLRMFNSGQVQVKLGKLPAGLITRPTLEWSLDAGAAGPHQIRTTYQTNGLTWRADYNLILNGENPPTAADLGAWVTLLNLSGASYADAKLKLIAGDVQRVQPRPMYAQMAMARAAAVDADTGFQEKPFYSYHLYTLPRRTDIKQNATQQIALFPTVHDVAVKQVYVYYGLPQGLEQYYVQPSPVDDRNLGNQSNHKVDVYIQLKNQEKNHLGIPLPRGKVRVYKRDAADDSLEFVGEDLIDHTPKDKTLLIKTGQAFDITGDRTQVDFSVNGHVITEKIKLVVHNPTKAPVDVVIKENLFRWVNWEITKQSDDYEKIDARTIHFNVQAPAEGEKEVEYTVRYSW